jgi:hypothetical protein
MYKENKAYLYDKIKILSFEGALRHIRGNEPSPSRVGPLSIKANVEVGEASIFLRSAGTRQHGKLEKLKSLLSSLNLANPHWDTNPSK